MRVYTVDVGTRSRSIDYLESISFRFSVIALDLQDATVKATLACTEIRQALEQENVPSRVTELFAVNCVSVVGEELYGGTDDNSVQSWIRLQSKNRERNNKHFE